MEFFPPEAYWRELRKRRLVLPPGHLHPSFEAFNKYLESYADAYTLKMRREELQLKVALLKARVAALESTIKEADSSREPDREAAGPKRRRRLADDINRHFQCPYERCRKVYGTLGSLQQHHRLKHAHDHARPILIEDISS